LTFPVWHVLGGDVDGFSVEIGPGIRSIEVSYPETGDNIWVTHCEVDRHVGILFGLKVFPVRGTSAGLAGMKGQPFVAIAVGPGACSTTNDLDLVDVKMSPQRPQATAY